MNRCTCQYLAISAVLAFSLTQSTAQDKVADTVPKPGTMIKATFGDEISSTSVSKGDSFNLKILFATLDGKRVTIPHESKLVGTILAEHAAHREDAGFITLKLDHIEFPDGTTAPISGEIQFLTLPKATIEPDGLALTLRGLVDQSDRMTVQSNTSNTPPPSSAEDLSHGDIKSPEKKRTESTGQFELTKKKGRDVVVPAGTSVNIKITEPPANPPTPATSNPTKPAH